MSIRNIFCILLIGVLQQTAAQQPTIKVLESGKRVSIRGLSVVDDNTIWASGSAGSVAKSTDGGNSFRWMKVPGYEKMDFRDIEAFDSSTAIIMGITTPAVILKTRDGGLTWKKVFEDTAKGAFLDAMEFHLDGIAGTVVGDPLNNKNYTLLTFDGGDTWKNNGGSVFPYLQIFPEFKDGEAFFASSGTNVQSLDDWGIVAVTGGKKSRLFHRGKFDSIPIMQGSESTGANSIAVYARNAVIVGGDFTKDTISSNNCVLVSFESFSLDLKSQKKNIAKMSIPQTPPHGYRSCVIYLDKSHLLTCGTSGIDISKDGGMNWELISKDSYHVCQKAKKGNAVFLAGNGGRIAKLILP